MLIPFESFTQVFNGSVLYSPQLTAPSYVSSSGQTLNILTNSTGNYVQSKNVTAMILRSDVPITNGVVHVIDQVLFDTEMNQGAANAA